MSNAKRVLTNSLFMYIRMGILMAISLFTSRALLKQLGVEDFGIYNLVGSIVLMFNSLRGLFANSTQRYLNIEMGKGNTDRLKIIFNISLYINLIIAFLFFVIVEIVGLWFFEYKININPERLTAAYIVFQFATLTAIVSILTTPFDAVIIANEHMKFYAYIAIIEAISKLLIVLMLAHSPFDKLIYYAILLFIVQLIICYINSRYCHKYFPESRTFRCWDKTLFKEMSSFSGWNFIGNFGFSLTNEGINMLLNVYGGPIVNAARGISYQVRSLTEQFLNSINKAVEPFSMKLYAQDKFNDYFYLLHLSSKALYLVYLCVSVPIFIFTEQILYFWLGCVPEYCVPFIRILMVYGVIRSVFAPLDVLFLAANKIKYYQIRNILISILQLFFAYYVLRIGCTYDAVFIVMVCAILLAYVTSLLQAWKTCGLDLGKYVSQVILKIFPHLICIAVIIHLITKIDKTNNFLLLVFSSLCIDIVILGLSYFLCFNSKERQLIIHIIRDKEKTYSS